MPPELGITTMHGFFWFIFSLPRFPPLQILRRRGGSGRRLRGGSETASMTIGDGHGRWLYGDIGYGDLVRGSAEIGEASHQKCRACVKSDGTTATARRSSLKNPMAFHVSCPITCRRICDCELGFADGLKSGRARADFLGDIAALEEFLRDPWSLRVRGEEEGRTVQVRVPRVVPQQRKPARQADDGEDQDRRAELQRQATAASVAAEDYVRRLEIGDVDVDLLGEVPSSHAGEFQCSSSIKVICRICFSGENEGSFKAQKMLPCKTCNKKYHRSCLKSWAEHRDLFHWSSWACPSCRTCEVCESVGDPNKLTFCKRCDGAFHCYCQQPPHKNVSHGPYVCQKHTRCHSCGSTVPGNGPSTRWFLGYTCCDACGRLFVKGNYCPVCLKVYRDSETTPMVCCDICERWIHCACDGISDEKYQQFQVDQNLQYTCAACRGDCYQVKDTDDAVRELWKRKDIAERKLIASLRAAAGLPSQEDISPDSDDGETCSIIPKNDYGTSLKFSVKGLSDNLTNNLKGSANTISKDVSPNKNHSKKIIKFVSNAEGSYQNYQKQNGERSLGTSFRTDGPESHVQSSKYNSVKNFGINSVDNAPKLQTESCKLQGLRIKESNAKMAHKNETVKGTKLVIHLGSKNKNVSSSPRSETSSCHREQDFAASYGNEDTSQQQINDRDNHMHESQGENVKSDGKGAKFDPASLRRSSKHGGREENAVKLGAVSDKQRKKNGSVAKECQLMATRTATPADSSGEERSDSDSDDDIVLKKKQPTGSSSVNLQTDAGHHTSRLKFFSSAASNDPKPLLKLKFKNPYFEQRTSWASRGEEENPVKGQRSKRKRPSAFEKAGADTGGEESAAKHHRGNPLTEQEMDANWILQKLGKDAIGKRVEVHQSSNNSWQKGVVSDVTMQRGSTSSSSLLVLLDNGRSTTLDLGKQAVRFASQKQSKRAKPRD